MDWKDTVMRSVEEVDGTTFLPADYISQKEHQNLMEAQAEISFKAGYKLAVNQNGVIGEKEKRAGIREVVGWIEEHEMHLNHNHRQWKAKLKEWGIK